MAATMAACSWHLARVVIIAKRMKKRRSARGMSAAVATTVAAGLRGVRAKMVTVGRRHREAVAAAWASPPAPAETTSRPRQQLQLLKSKLL
jgi:hypothetical protein